MSIKGVIIAIIFLSKSHLFWGQDTVKVPLTHRSKLKTDLNYFEVAAQNPDILDFDIISGKVITNKSKFTLGIFNANKNNLYNDVGVDKILTGLYNEDDLYIEGNSDYVSNNNYIIFDSEIWKIVEINSEKKYCMLVREKRIIPPESTINFITRLPDFSFKLFGGEIVTKKKILKSRKPSVFIFWSTSCPSSLHELLTIDTIYKRYSKQIAIYGINGDSINRVSSNINSLLNKYQVKWPQTNNTSEIAKTFRQNNLYPVSLMFDSKGDLISTNVTTSQTSRLLSYKNKSH